MINNLKYLQGVLHMKKNNQIYVSGMLNFEADLRVQNFPIHYYPIDYPFFDIDTFIGGSGYNISMALRNFNNDVTIAGFVGKDKTGYSDYCYQKYCKYIFFHNLSLCFFRFKGC